MITPGRFWVFTEVDADTNIAKMEEKIRRVLASKGPSSARDLGRATNAKRAGLWAFNSGITNLIKAGDIKLKKNKYFLVEDCDAGRGLSSVLSSCHP